MLRKIRLIIASAKFCFIRGLEFRNQVIIWAIAGTIWALISLLGISVIFSQIETIAGWNKEEVMLLTITQEIFVGIMYVAIIPSLLNLSEVIRTGNFDFYLLKPVSSRFLSSIARFEFDQYPRITILFIILFKLVGMFGFNVSIYSMLGYLITLMTGVGIFYSLFFMFTATTFWFTRIHNHEDFIDSIMSAGRFPTDVYGGLLRIVYFYLVPVVFIATFPTQFLLGKGSLSLVVLGIVICVIFYSISQLFWNFALKHYSSASS